VRLVSTPKAAPALPTHVVLVLAAHAPAATAFAMATSWAPIAMLANRASLALIALQNATVALMANAMMVSVVLEPAAVMLASRAPHATKAQNLSKTC